MGHEASVSKISEGQLLCLMSRGMTENEAAATAEGSRPLAFDVAAAWLARHLRGRG